MFFHHYLIHRKFHCFLYNPSLKVSILSNQIKRGSPIDIVEKFKEKIREKTGLFLSYKKDVKFLLLKSGSCNFK